MFKDILREYRRLDDAIVMRLNRANASMRDQDRLHGSNANETLQDQACVQIWRELVGNWKRRTQLIEYCVGVVDQSLKEKQAALLDGDQDPVSTRKTQGGIFEDEVKRTQVRKELSVDAIVQRRSMEAFRARCQFFVPPTGNDEARKMWDVAHR
ncbi:unnamed protein product [Cyclocybe aegerita]|uniref:Caffeine-induced death protein 2 n=1 Tax=Cyclocybe aegerita TaxID=1973307 RepID=A0A8S0WDM4_CYCAE|nr:unnamed protein product [Cyclocybe aegerita]